MPAWLVSFLTPLVELLVRLMGEELRRILRERDQVIKEPTDAPLVKPPHGPLPPVVGLPRSPDPGG
jgi:hypothetical protein